MESEVVILKEDFSYVIKKQDIWIVYTTKKQKPWICKPDGIIFIDNRTIKLILATR